MLCKSAEGKGGYCNNISSMANSSILSNLMLLVLPIDNPILLPSLQYLLLCTQIFMSDTPTNANQYSEITFMESFRRIKEATGVSKPTSELLAAGWQKGTYTAYNSCCRQWSTM